MTDHYAGAPGCECAICRPHLNGPARSDPVEPVASVGSGEAVIGAAASPPFPPKRREPPKHYLKGKPEPWRPWVNYDGRDMGPVGRTHETFSHNGYKRG